MTSPTVTRPQPHRDKIFPSRRDQHSWATRWLSPLSLATLMANVLIVVTGGLVRLTDSGLGCPTWPRCTDSSYVTTPASGIHGYVEFGNRLLTFVLVAVVGATFVAAWLIRKNRPELPWLAGIQLGGIFLQATLGGITVLTDLNPWTVAGHFMVSMALIFGAYVLWRRVREGDGERRYLVSDPLQWLARIITGMTAAVLVLGTLVTGSGPHSGDSAAARTGFDPESMSQLHADAVFLLLGLTIAAWFAFVNTTGTAGIRRALALLLYAEFAQGGIGFVQYLNGLPIVLVTAHLLGACLVWLAAVNLLFATRVREAHY